MVKIRDHAKAKKSVTPDEVEAFAAGADEPGKAQSPDPNAKRDYKSVRMNFNKFEHEALLRLSKKTGRSKMGAIRWAVVYMADQVSKEG